MTFLICWLKVFLPLYSLGFLYKCLSLQCLHAEASLWSRGGGDGHISNGVFLRFGFDCSKSWENFQTMSRTKQWRITLGMLYLCNPYYARCPKPWAIYKRAMKLAYGDDWVYDYEGFVRFDENSRNMESRSVFKLLTEEEQKEYIKKHRSPILIKGIWRDVMKISDSFIRW